MAEFLLKPNDFQKQVDSFKTTTETVTALKYTLEKELEVQFADVRVTYANK